ncbi:MAG: DNA polymerase III subunit gamma/tau [Acidobacteriota bacterium]|nr:DNA polymerase III subunit gamma/tau [Acidobacteriota bacterium]
MSYQVLARKWRPQTFASIVGQGATAETLKNAISQNRIAHAYLFAGARGVGKTTTARILAKALNCQQGPTVNPCNDCASCREVTSGQSIDVLEIDAASNRGIDEIRELRESVRYRAARDRYKVFIIDEVHMLTTEAFNALLKTLEEPPAHVVFILATTELHKVPGTILSRCQHFNFRAISYREIFERLELIAREERVRIGERALSAIARASEGSLRDGESLLDQAISLCGEEVGEEQVRDLLGVVPQQLLEDVAAAVIARDTKQVLALVDQVLTSGRNPQQLVRELMGHFRNLLMVKVAGKDSQLVAAPAEDLARLQTLSAQLSEEDVTRFFQILVATEGELRGSAHPRLHLELGLVRMVQAKRLAALEELLAAFSGDAPPGNPEPPATPGPPRSAPSPPPAIFQDSGPPTPAVAGTLLDRIREAAFSDSPMVASLLGKASDATVAGDEIRVRFAAGQRGSRELLQDGEKREVIARASAKLEGRRLKVSLLVEEDGPSSGTPLPAEVPPRTEVMPPSEDEIERRESKRILEDKRVQSFLEVFQVQEKPEVRKLK